IVTDRYAVQADGKELLDSDNGRAIGGDLERRVFGRKRIYAWHNLLAEEAEAHIDAAEGETDGAIAVRLVEAVEVTVVVAIDPIRSADTGEDISVARAHGERIHRDIAVAAAFERQGQAATLLEFE